MCHSFLEYKELNMNIILDTSVIQVDPQLLAQNVPGKFLVPDTVIGELFKRRKSISSENLHNLISKAVAANRLEIVSTVSNPELQSLMGIVIPPNLDGADIDIYRLALLSAQREGPENVVVITRDLFLRKALGAQGIKSFVPTEWRQKNAEASRNEVIEKAAVGYLSNVRKILVVGVGYTAIALGIALPIFYNLSLLIAITPVVVIFLLIPLFGISLYALRQWQRFGYGLFEFIVGAIVCYSVIFPDFKLDSPQVSNLTQILQIAGGLYVIVRGLDNIGKATENTQYEALWKRFFP